MASFRSLFFFTSKISLKENDGIPFWINKFLKTEHQYMKILIFCVFNHYHDRLVFLRMASFYLSRWFSHRGSQGSTFHTLIFQVELLSLLGTKCRFSFFFSSPGFGTQLYTSYQLSKDVSTVKNPCFVTAAEGMLIATPQGLLTSAANNTQQSGHPEKQ